MTLRLILNVSDGELEFDSEDKNIIKCTSCLLRDCMEMYGNCLTLNITDYKITKIMFNAWLYKMKKFIGIHDVHNFVDKIKIKKYIIMNKKTIIKLNNFLGGYDFSMSINNNVVKLNNEEIMEYMIVKKYVSSDICNNIVSYGFTNLLRIAHKNNCEWDEKTCTKAASFGKIECLRYLRENGCKWNETTTRYAAYFGKYECLKYAIDNGCKFDLTTTNCTALSDNVLCLKYIINNGGQYNSTTLYNAAYGGRTENLIYLKELGCEWNSKLCFAAVKNNKLECLKFLVDNGCEIEIETCKYLTYNTNIYNYLCELHIKNKFL